MSDLPRTKAALYFRQSLDVAEGIDRQRIRCRALAAARDWEVVQEYEDNDTSASKARGSGTAWSRLLEDAINKKFTVVIAVDIDRLLRTITDLIILTETGAKVLTVDGEIDLTTADGEFRATMLAGIARFEARRKGERQLRANAHAASQGRRTSGRKPFGYESDGMTVKDDEAAAVVDGFRDFLTGVPLAGIARNWAERGFVTGVTRYKAGHEGEPGLWTARGVRDVLMNPRYMAKRAHLGEIVADAQWPALVDESTWLSVNAILSDPSRRSMTPRRGRYLLSGLAVCSVCRSTAHAGGKARANMALGYRCGEPVSHFGRKSEPVDEYVQAVMVARLSRPDARELLTVKPASDGRDLPLEAVGLRARLESLAVDFADGELTASQLRVATERLRERLSVVEREMADASRLDVLGSLVGAVDVQAAWDALTVEKKRAVISVLATIVIYPPGAGRRHFDPATVGIEWLS